MAIEAKYLLIGIIILFGLTWINSLQEPAFDRITDLRIAPVENYRSNLNLIKDENFNLTREERSISRYRIAHKRYDFPVTNFLRYNFDLNLNSYFREKNSRIREIFSRRENVRHSSNKHSEYNFTPLFLYERQKTSNSRHHFKRLVFPLQETFNDLKGNLYRNKFRNFELGELRNSNQPNFRFVDRGTAEYFRGLEKNWGFFSRRGEDSLLRKFAVEIRTNGGATERRERDGNNIRKGFNRSFSRNHEEFSQIPWTLCAIITTKITYVANYLFTIIAGLLFFDFMRQIAPMKRPQKSELKNFIHDVVQVTGNAMIY